MKFDVHYFVSSKHAQKIASACVLLFFILILGELTSLFTPLARKSPIVPVVDKTIKPAESNSVNALLHSSLFGAYLSHDLNDDQVEKSMLHVTVVGILVGNPDTESQVIIREANGEETTFKVDDKISDGVLIKRITSDGVFVEHDGVIESLSLPSDKLHFEPIAKPLIDK